MKKKAILVLLFIIILLGIEQSIADVTSSGSTTNTQSNNAGSNTAITGGYESATIRVAHLQTLRQTMRLTIVLIKKQP